MAVQVRSASVTRAISVYSISPLPMWPMGPKQGMPSIAAFHRELAKNGVKVTFIYVGRGDQRAQAEADAENIEVLYGRSWDFIPKKGLFGKVIAKFLSVPLWVASAIVAALPVVARAKRRNERLVIYGHTAPGSIAASIIGFLLRVPNVSRFYGTLTPFKLGVSEQYPVGRVQRWVNVLKQWDEILALKLPADRYVITDDGTLGDRLFMQIRGSRDRLLFLRNGIDIPWEEWLRRPRETALFDQLFSQRRPTVISAGRLIPWKRMDRIISIADELVNRRGVGVNFLILGTGELRERLEREICDRGLTDFVKVKTDVPHADMPRYLIAADVVLLMQDYTNLSNTLLEALALERPIVALDVGGTSSVVTNGVNGVLVSLSNWREEASAAIIRLIEDEEYRERLRKGCRAWKCEHAYTWEKRIRWDLELIRELTLGANNWTVRA